MSSILAEEKRPILYEPKCGEGGRGGGFAGSQPMSTAMHNAHVAQINFGDLTLY
jgi:hypothetical protein